MQAESIDAVHMSSPRLGWVFAGILALVFSPSAFA